MNTIRLIAVWVIINTVVGTIIASFLSIGIAQPFSKVFLASQVTTHLISSFSAVTAYTFGRRMLRASRSLPMHGLVIFITCMAATAATGLALIIDAYFIKLGLFPSFTDYLVRLYVPILIITVLITVIAIIIHTYRNRLLDIPVIQQEGRDDSSRGLINGLTIRERGEIHVLNFEDIIYLSSHGRKTIIHTKGQDYEINQFLKTIDQRLPRGFFRIHKQFVINVNYVSRMLYHAGGRYLVYLNDEDESILPVGRNYASLLKGQLRD